MIKEMEILKLGDEPFEIVDRKSRDDLATTMVEVANTKAEVANAVKKPLRAEVGQALIVKAVDENGVPTEFEAGKVASDEEWDLDWELTGTYVKDEEGNEDMNFTYNINSMNTFENIKNKILSGIQPKCKVKVISTGWGNTDPTMVFTESFDTMHAAYGPENQNEGVPESIYFQIFGAGTDPYMALLADGTVADYGDGF